MPTAFDLSEAGPVYSAAPAPGEVAPTFTSGNTTNFNVGFPENFLITTAGSPMAFISEVGTLPQGVVFFDNVNGSATLGGTPAPGTAGTYTFDLVAANGVAPDAVQHFILIISP